MVIVTVTFAIHSFFWILGSVQRGMIDHNLQVVISVFVTHPNIYINILLFLYGVQQLCLYVCVLVFGVCLCGTHVIAVKRRASIETGHKYIRSVAHLTMINKQFPTKQLSGTSHFVSYNDSILQTESIIFLSLYIYTRATLNIRNKLNFNIRTELKS